MTRDARNLIWFDEVARGDVALVGGKNASLGEMTAALAAKGIRVPPGFATTAAAFRSFLAANRLDEVIAGRLAALDAGRTDLASAGRAIREAITGADWPEGIAAEIRAAYAELARRTGRDSPAVAVRSSATAEDLPDASFAGQQETFLNITGEGALLVVCRRCSA